MLGEVFGALLADVFYAEAVDEARAYLDRISAQWDASLSRLKAFVERDIL